MVKGETKRPPVIHRGPEGGGIYMEDNWFKIPSQEKRSRIEEGT